MAKEDILTASQKQVIKLIADESRLASFYLSGGTALSAFYLQHRLSDDLDFFSTEPIDVQFILAFVETLKENLNSPKVRFERLYDRNIFFLELVNDKELKIEFTRYQFKRLGRIAKRAGISVDSLRDLAANKLMAMIDRFDPKDFVDLYFLLKRFSLNEIRMDAEKKFNIKIGGMLLGSELAKVRRIVALPIMLMPATIDELKIFFAKKAREVGVSVIK